ncbi:MAG TPA: dephospho-CoA kinase [Bryobacteraceae bacterium]|nr:dephospho-CoA kinase [Bryobacteraceae bacterium]
MLKVGLTGGIASGKSVVGEMFVALGAHLVEADRIAHSLMQPGEPVYHEVVRQFGREILNPDATVNRGKLAEAAFGPPGADQRPARVADLNRIVHPAVIRSQEEWMHAVSLQNPDGVAMVEAALLIEAGAAKRFDRLIVVTCTLDHRVERFAKRQKLDLETARAEVARRMAAQLPDEEKIKAADYVIDNSGALEHTGEQVRQIWEKLRAAH